jgi:hexosaminidase
MKNKYNFLFLLLAVLIFFSGNSKNVFAQLSVIPKPISIEQTSEYYVIKPETIIYIHDEEWRNDAEFFRNYLNSYYGLNPTILFSPNLVESDINLYTSRDKMNVDDYYKLDVSKNGIFILGKGGGTLYGLQTLIQLLPPEKNKNLKVPGVKIVDYPKFKWRGMHLDVCRHFFQKEFIKRYIDFIAMYKMNTFHWHLTDDQGWRIEIKKYPKLTEVGAWRKGTIVSYKGRDEKTFDTIPYGGFYTQEDVKEIVEYATLRHVTIVPEIEMPGHSLAALASYPEYSCTGGPFEVEREWGVFEDVFCPTEKTFGFLEDVLTEVMELFPSQYIHIGGDECPKDRWKKCEYCQELMKKEGLKDENELQSYFTKRIEKFLDSKGRKLVGWDEILEGGIAPNATIMSWRGVQGGIDASHQGHDVVMTPGAYCYFDHYQADPLNEPKAIGGYTTVEKVYSFNPVPEELNKDEKLHILGAQGNVWTEYIATTEKVEYMVFPRIAALAEVLWTPIILKNYDDFRARLLKHFKLLDFLHINYSHSIYELKTKMIPLDSKDGISFEIKSDFNEKGIYYTKDGSEPSDKSINYTSPLIIKKSEKIKAGYFENRKQIGNTIEKIFNINKATGKNVTLNIPPNEKYSFGGPFTVVDGVTGQLPWVGKEWLGFEGTDFDAVVDLGSVQKFSKVIVDLLDAQISWIYLPKSIEIFISDDGINFTSLKKFGAEEIIKQKRAITFELGNQSASYVKVVAGNYGKIPAGMPGAGENAWLFVDEISIE